MSVNGPKLRACDLNKCNSPIAATMLELKGFIGVESEKKTPSLLLSLQHPHDITGELMNDFQHEHKQHIAIY